MKFDVETLVYIFFLVVFLLSRILRGRKKTAPRKAEPRPQEPYQPQEPEPKKENPFEEMFGELIRDLEGKEKAEQQPEKPPVQEPITQEPEILEPKEPRPEWKVFEKEGVSGFKTDGDETTFDEGAPAVYKQLGDDLTSSENFLGRAAEDGEEEEFSFDPREAYLLKTLLDRPYQ